MKNDEKHVNEEKWWKTCKRWKIWRNHEGKHEEKHIKMEKNILKIVILWLGIQVKNNKTKGNISKSLSNQ